MELWGSMSKDDKVSKTPPTSNVLAGAVVMDIDKTQASDGSSQSSAPAAAPAASRSTTPSAMRRGSSLQNLSGHAGQMWKSFTGHVAHPFWKEARDKSRRSPAPERRMKSAFQEAAGQEADATTTVAPRDAVAAGNRARGFPTRARGFTVASSSPRGTGTWTRSSVGGCRSARA